MAKRRNITKNITRRDFLDGVAIGATAAAVGATFPSYAQSGGLTPDYYPPSLTGMRGNHDGSFDHAHPLAWYGEAPEEVTATGEEYDLIIVGGGISGLAAACMWQRERGADQRILILDNHDDFGGHAKRNEFMVNGKMLLGAGGSLNLENPDAYSDESKRLLSEVGIDLDRLAAAQGDDALGTMGGDTGLFLKSADGTGTITTGNWSSTFHGYGNYEEQINKLPLPKSEKDKIIRLSGGDWDYLVGLSIPERIAYLDSTPYHQFLIEKVGLKPETLSLFDSVLRVLFGVGGDGITVHEAMLTGAPGLGVVGWPWEIVESLFFGGDAPYANLMFPDGNASVARLMVRHLIPEIASGNSMDDIVTAKFDYSKLDEESSSVRIRLGSTAIKAKQNGDKVTVRYVKDGKPWSAEGNHAILACFNSIIPHLCPEMSEEQKEGLKYGSKIPLVMASIAIRDGSVFERTGVNMIDCPGSYFPLVTYSPTTKMADYQAPQGTGEPRALYLLRSPVPLKEPGKTVRETFRDTRHLMLATPFSDIEEEICEQLNDVFGPYGFDADRDIEAITVNRWAHGYSYEYYGLDDHFEDGEYPHEIGRKQFGRISIANSDAGASAYLNVAIDQAWRAVQEQL